MPKRPGQMSVNLSGRRINVCVSVGQNGQRGELCAQGYSAFLVQEKGGGSGGSLECEESKVIKCQEARSSPTHLSERRELEDYRPSGSRGRATKCGKCQPCQLWSPAGQVSQQKLNC